MATRKRTQAVRETQARYDRTHTRQIPLKLNLGTDADILDWLDGKENRSGYIKQLIRRDMALHRPQAAEEAEPGAREQDASAS